MTQAPGAPKQIVGAGTGGRASAVFTEGFGTLKPPEHNGLELPIAETLFERRVGGHTYDRGTHGPDPQNAGEVDVRFVGERPERPERPERTGVEFEQRNFDRHAPGLQAVAGGVGPEGWPSYLERHMALFSLSDSTDARRSR